MAFSWTGMDISIHTLTGAIFDLRVSPFESVISIKSKLERLEGIPTSQQHLIWQSIELADDACLHDYGIRSGATLTLVLAMKDGPVNMRRVEVANESMDGVELLMNEQNKDELWEQLMMAEDKKHVTFLVFCEGDHLNFFRVCERSEGEGSSPQAHTCLIDSPQNVEDEISEQEKQKENVITKDKMKLIRQQIEAKCMKKEARIIQASRPPSTANILTKILSPSANLASRILSSREVPSQCSTMMQSSTTPNATEGNSNMFLNIQITPSPIKEQFDSPDPQLCNTVPQTPHSPSNDKTPLPSIGSKERDNLGANVGTTSASFSGKGSANAAPIAQKSSFKNTSNSRTSNSKYTSRSSSKIKNERKDKKPKEKQKLGRVKKNILPSSESLQRNTASQSNSAAGKKVGNHCTLPELNSLVSSNVKENKKGPPSDDTLDTLHLPGIDGDPTDKENRAHLLNWVQSKRNDRLEEQSTNNFTAYGKGGDSIGYYRERSITRLRSAASHVTKGNMKCLPPIHNEAGTKLPTLTGKKKLRCCTCTKKLGLTTTYECRCGGTFCPKHRYPETHTCTFDFKTEGRRILERNNPVVTAPKLPKI